VGLRSALKGSWELTTGLGRIASALERLAEAAERGWLPPVPSAEEDSSAVFYTSREEQIALEARQERFFLDTGIRLGPGEEPPPSHERA